MYGAENTYIHFKGIDHSKIKIMSSFTHSRVVPNLYDFISSVEYERK